jgi:ABC-type methionine transport system ATPase subunit
MAKGKKPSTTKRAVKLLAVCKDPKVRSVILSRSPDSVIKTICNAALNVEQGDLALTKQQKTAFRKHRNQIHKLTSRHVPLSAKRKVLRGGAFPILPLLLSAAISTLGPLLFGRGE